jgi:hypothetical protein
VAKQGDVWLREMAKGDGCLNRDIDGIVGSAACGFESRHLSKIQNWQRSGQHAVARQKNKQKMGN